MRRLIAIGIVLACAGCATPGDVAKKVPVDTFTTSKSPQAFVECAMPLMIKAMSLSRVIPKTGGQQIIGSASAYGVVAALVDVDEREDGGSRIEVRLGPVIGSIGSDTVRFARSCQ